MIPRDKICCFTGHRNLPARMLPDLKRRLADAIELLIGQGVCCFAAGGARGFDALAAREVLKKRERYPHIKLDSAMSFSCFLDTAAYNDQIPPNSSEQLSEVSLRMLPAKQGYR